jgi:hypothetical protein
MELIIMLCNDRGDEFGIRVPLPLNDLAYLRIERQLADLEGLVCNRSHIDRFYGQLAYLPKTTAQLDLANAIYRETGRDWHTSCAMAREQQPS